MPKTSEPIKEPIKRLLVVVAHADDETFGCGGTIALETSRGNEATVCCLTGTAARHRELGEACEIIGAETVALTGKDMSLTVPEVVNALIPIIQEIKPLVIITHNAADYHPDHRVVNQAVFQAAEWAGHSTLYKKKAWRPERLLTMEINTLLSAPSLLVDISEVIELKTQAIMAYQSQLKKTDEYYLLFNLQKARLRGLQSRCEYAEAFTEKHLTIHGPFYQPLPKTNTVFR